MNGNDFKESLKNPLSLYCLVSTDSALVDLYVKRFKEAIGAELVIRKTFRTVVPGRAEWCVILWGSVGIGAQL